MPVSFYRTFSLLILFQITITSTHLPVSSQKYSHTLHPKLPYHHQQQQHRFRPPSQTVYIAHQSFHDNNHFNANRNNRYGAGAFIRQPTLPATNCKRVCYFRMDPKTEIRLSHVDGKLCTHVILAFARIDSNGNLIFGSEHNLGYLLEVPEFKRKNPGIKVMISVYNEHEHNGFPKVAASAELRQRFSLSVIEFLQRFHLDGIDLDWEFPNFPTTFVGREHERSGLTKILKSLRTVIVENFFNRQVAQQHELQASSSSYGRQTYGTSASSSVLVEPYLMTVAVAGQEAVLRAAYELKQVANLCDWLNVMSYDYFLFKPYAPFTGPNSPLYPIVDPYVPIVSKLSLAWTMSKLLEEEIPKDKIVMGIPTYARAYRLVFHNSQPAPFTLALGAKGGSRVDDYLDYREVCDILRRADTVSEFDSRGRVPYLLTDAGYTWVSYENEQSVREKVKFVLDNQLAGYMTWNLNSDDFIGIASSLMMQQTNNQGNTNQHTPNGNNVLEPVELPTAFPLHSAMLDEVNSYVPGARRASDGAASRAIKQQPPSHPI